MTRKETERSMSKNATKSPPIETETEEDAPPKFPTSPAMSSALTSPANDVGSGKMSHTNMNAILKAEGGTLDHVGGTLPPIRFDNTGDAFLLCYLGREAETEDRDFAILTWEVLSPLVYRETGDIEKSKLYRGSIAESWAFVEWCGKPENVGRVAKVTYLGEQKAREPKPGRSAVKLYAIEAYTRGGAGAKGAPKKK